MKKRLINLNNHEEVNNNKKRRLRAVGYVRQAAVPQHDDESRLSEQHERCQQVADQLAADIIDTYEDLGTSGRYLDRPGLIALLKRLKRSPRIDYVIAADRSRLNRNAWSHLLLIEEIERSGARLVTAQDEAVEEEPLSPWMIKKLERIIAGMNRRIDRQAVAAARAQRRSKEDVVNSTVASKEP